MYKLLKYKVFLLFENFLFKYNKRKRALLFVLSYDANGLRSDILSKQTILPSALT